MTQIVLPITSRGNTDPNNFSDVYSNDNAIATVVNGDLRNDNIAAAGTANIAVGKLAAGTGGQIIVCNASGIPTYRTASGDVTVSNTGVTSIATDAVTNSKIAANAVDTSEINASAVTTAKINDGAVTNAKLGLTGASDCTLASDTALTSTYATIATVNVSSGHAYWVAASVHLQDGGGSGISDTTISLNYNGAEHVSESVEVAFGALHFSTALPIIITSGSAITLKAKDSSVNPPKVMASGSGYLWTRLSVLQIS